MLNIKVVRKILLPFLRDHESFFSRVLTSKTAFVTQNGSIVFHFIVRAIPLSHSCDLIVWDVPLWLCKQIDDKANAWLLFICFCFGCDNGNGSVNLLSLHFDSYNERKSRVPCQVQQYRLIVS
ncbi:hypothetical protein NPIL_204431 [Nephila pilipes]|uniref:Uncharacterized protein n=1 Tax=Nephila pilipes TaxID=299642 RepID=A0A8X6P8T6_NEPPI|nr:hypothetical protein NPIL_204431 [Nephila pilipes]